jgi:hypothetical protein
MHVKAFDALLTLACSQVSGSGAGGVAASRSAAAQRGTEVATQPGASSVRSSDSLHSAACGWPACVFRPVPPAEPPKNARMLLVILFARYMAAITTLDSRDS